MRFGLPSLSPRNLPNAGAILIAIKSYFDGSKRDGNCMTLAGVAATDTVWPEIEALWDEVRRTRGNPRFIHMTDLMALHGIYEGWQKDDRNWLVSGLLSVLLSFRTNPGIHSFTSTVHLDAYAGRSKISRLPTPERLCSRMVFPMVLEWWSQTAPAVDVGFLEAYFDRNEGFMRHIREDWTNKKIRAKHPVWALVRSVTEADMELTTALQITDAVAWGRNRLATGSTALTDSDHAIAVMAALGLNWTSHEWDDTALSKFNYREEGYAAIDPQRLKQEAQMVNASAEFKQFDRMMRELMKVPHAEIKAKLDAEKEQKKRKAKKPSASDRASREKD